MQLLCGVQIRICYDDAFRAIDCQQAKQVEDCKGSLISLPAWQKSSPASVADQQLLADQ